MAIATPPQHSASIPRLTARELTSVAEGHGTPFGANIRSPVHVPATISASRKADTSVVSTMVRVITQCRANGRARIKSMKPVSTSDAGVVASVTAIAIRAPMTANWKYPRHTIPENDMKAATDGPSSSRANGGSSAAS